VSEERIYTLTADQLVSLLVEAEEGFKVSRIMLQHYLEKREQNQVCALLAEVFWASHNIRRIVKEEMLDSPVTEDGQIMVTEQPLVLLQTLVLSKDMANKELLKYSISMKLH